MLARRFRFLSMVLVCLALVAPVARAGDDEVEDPESKRFNTPIPKKRFDLDKVDVSRPPVRPQTVQEKEKEIEEKAKEIVRYSSVEIAPEGASLILEIPDLARMRLDARSSPLGRLMSDELLGGVWRKLALPELRNIPPTGKGLPGGAGLVDAFGRINTLLSGEVVLAVYPPEEGQKGYRLLLVAEMDEARRFGFIDATDDLRAWAGFGKDSRIVKESLGEFVFDRIESSDGRTAAYGFVGNQLVIELGRGKYEQVLETAKAKGERSLARAPARARAREVLGKDNDLYVRAEIRMLADLLASSAKTEDERKAVRTHLDGVHFAAASLSFKDDAVHEKFYVEMDPECQVYRMMPAGTPDPGLAQLIPLDACCYGLLQVKPGAVASGFAQAKGQMPAMEKMFAELEKKSEFSIEEDILPALAGDMACALTITGMGISVDVDMLVVLRPADRKKADAVLAGLERLWGADVQSLDYQRARIKYWEKPKERSVRRPVGLPPWQERFEEMAANPAGPIKAFAISGKDIILGSSLRGVKMAVRQKDRLLRSSSILDKPDFKSARELMDSAGEVSSGYLDLQRFGELLYSLAGMAAGAGLNINLPPAEIVLDELGGLTWSVCRKEKGMVVEVLSPVGLIPLAGAGTLGGWLAGVHAQAAHQQREHTRKLKTIWRGLETFATDFRRYPLNLAELYPVHVEDISNFVTPTQEKQDPPVKLGSTLEIGEKSGYVYVSGRRPNAAGDNVIVYAAEPDARGFHWCLFSSGMVTNGYNQGARGITPEVLNELLAKRKRTASGR